MEKKNTTKMGKTIQMENKAFVLSYYNGYYDEWKKKKTYSNYNEVLEFLWKKFTKSSGKNAYGDPMEPEVNGYTFEDTIYCSYLEEDNYRDDKLMNKILKATNSWKEFLETIKDEDFVESFCLDEFSSKDKAIVSEVGNGKVISQAQILLDLDTFGGLNKLCDFNEFKKNYGE